MMGLAWITIRLTRRFALALSPSVIAATDLGKFGMGLVTAGLSLSRRTQVITKQTLRSITRSIVDVDEIQRTNTFCKHLAIKH